MIYVITGVPTSLWSIVVSPLPNNFFPVVIQ